MKRLVTIMFAVCTILAYMRGGLWEACIPLVVVLVFSIGWSIQNVWMGLPYDYNAK